MTTDNPDAARAFLEARIKLAELSARLAPIEEHYLSMDGSGSAGMELAGIYDDYMAKSRERADVVAEMKQLRTEAGDEAILAGLKNLQGSELAIKYIQQVPLESEMKSEAKKETRKGFFGRFR